MKSHKKYEDLDIFSQSLLGENKEKISHSYEYKEN